MAIPGVANNLNGSAAPYTSAFTVDDVNKANYLTDYSVPQNASETGTNLYDGTFDPLKLSDHNVSARDMEGKVIGSTIDEVMNRLNTTLHIQNGSDTVISTYNDMANNYNRFKVALPNSMLRTGYAHVFFVKPSCNIWADSTQTSLASGLSGNELFAYAFKGNSGKTMLKELSATKSHQFMFTLSNAAISFTPQDEYIQDDTYGRGYTGYKIAFGKRNVESRTAGSFEIEYQDDENLHIYQTHKLWEEYINGVYCGEFSPLPNHIRDKILDYVGALYYIVVGSDGETIIFWTKYYGVFPVTAPSSQLAWTAGNALDGNSTKLTISYRYSMKADFDPYCIREFNMNSSAGSSSSQALKSAMSIAGDVVGESAQAAIEKAQPAIQTGTLYQPIYDSRLGHIGPTWVGDPFIEEHITNNEVRYILRHRPA